VTETQNRYYFGDATPGHNLDNQSNVSIPSYIGPSTGQPNYNSKILPFFALGATDAKLTPGTKRERQDSVNVFRNARVYSNVSAFTGVNQSDGGETKTIADISIISGPDSPRMSRAGDDMLNDS
jgi:hypothetical protein